MKNKLLKGFSLLTIGAIGAKILGGIYKIALTRILGSTSFGVYQQILPVYTFLVVLVSSGVPLGISKLLVKKEDKLASVKLCLKIFLILSLLISFILFLLAKPIARMQGQSHLSWAYYILAPAIIFSGITAVLKGYFQSYEEFKPTALAQITEQVAKLVFGLGLSLLFVNFSKIYQILGATLGIAIADLSSLIILYFYFRKTNHKKSNSSFTKAEAKELFKTVFPIMLASLILPFSQFVDSVIVVKLLNKNFEQDMSVYLYGLQSGVVGTLISFPSVITFSLVSIMLPSLTLDFHNSREEAFKNKLTFVFKLILLLVVPCALFVLFYPDRIISLFYGASLDGFNVNGVNLTSKLLFWSAFNIVFSCFSQFLSVVLQAREKRYLPAVNNFLGMLIKTVLILVFVPSRQLNILAYSLASAVGYLVIFLLNMYELLVDVKIKIENSFFTKLTLINIIVVGCSLLLSLLDNGNINFILIIIFSIVSYLTLLIGIKIFSKEEVKKYLKP